MKEVTFKRFDDTPNMTKRAWRWMSDLQRKITAHPVDNPIYSMNLEQYLDLTGPEVRAIVSHLRVNAIPPFIGSGVNGYFHATKAEELESTIDQIEGRITRLQRVAMGLKRAQARLRCGDTQLDMQI